MRTPSLRRRVTLSGVVVFALLVLVLDVFVYLTLRVQLEATLDEVLAARAELARELDALLEPDELAGRLQALGVPVVVTTAAGEVIEAEPAVVRFREGPPGPLADVPHPRVSETVALDDGGSAEVFATRAGVDSTLNRVLALLAIGTAVALAAAIMLFRRSTAAAMAPLEQVVAAAGRTAAGQPGERLHPDTPDTELGRMAVAYDQMLDALEDALAQAQDAEARTRRFLDDAAHQLRTPLAAIRASVESLLREADAGQRDRLMANLVRETARSSRVLTSLLTLARLDEGRPPTREPTDLVALCRDEVERAASLAPHLTLTLDEPPRPLPELPLAEAEVRDAVANLLDNARRHARARIHVEVTDDVDGVSVQVGDDGPGVPEADRAAMFERFATLDGHGGSGLGLPIARAVARSHGGEVDYDGNRFVLRIPHGDVTPAAGHA